MDKPTLPALHELHQRHLGLTWAVCAAYFEAASVSMSRHHDPPSDLDIEYEGKTESASLTWAVPDARTKGAWNNQDDATCQGAYGISLAAVEHRVGLLAVDRTEHRFSQGLSATTCHNDRPSVIGT
ncbi:MAG: hypothetical protein FJZ01_10995 [Candidatus Sericytochromatia bacterium]|nr:hypothetical protein [Candidatus Tanganyikabacteria bacterium]